MDTPSEWWQERERRLAQLMWILGVRRAKSGRVQFPLHFGLLFDHAFFFRTKGGDIFIWDDPYDSSRQLENEPLLIKEEWRVVRLPKQMTLHLMGATQPRLVAPPRSCADLDHLAALLMLAEYVGNKGNADE